MTLETYTSDDASVPVVLLVPEVVELVELVVLLESVAAQAAGTISRSRMIKNIPGFFFMVSPLHVCGSSGWILAELAGIYCPTGPRPDIWITIARVAYYIRSMEIVLIWIKKGIIERAGDIYPKKR